MDIQNNPSTPINIKRQICLIKSRQKFGLGCILVSGNLVYGPASINWSHQSLCIPLLQVSPHRCSRKWSYKALLVPRAHVNLGFAKIQEKWNCKLQFLFRVEGWSEIILWWLALYHGTILCFDNLLKQNINLFWLFPIQRQDWKCWDFFHFNYAQSMHSIPFYSEWYLYLIFFKINESMGMTLALEVFICCLIITFFQNWWCIMWVWLTLGSYFIWI